MYMRMYYMHWTHDEIHDGIRHEINRLVYLHFLHSIFLTLEHTFEDFRLKTYWKDHIIYNLCNKSL